MHLWWQRGIQHISLGGWNDVIPIYLPIYLPITYGQATNLGGSENDLHSNILAPVV
jgi:hypothetical protein